MAAMIMRFLRRTLWVLALALLPSVPARAVTELPSIPLTIGKHKLVAEVAATPDERSTGLMHRFSLKPDHGMIFVFEHAEPQGFWMKNTFIPLSIAFIGSDGRIVNIDDMAPQDERTHWSSGPAQYALEMRKGWFAERGIVPGDRVEGLPKPKP
jgi:uncharacterized membrane protein (UPF0127 family)